MSNFDHKEMAYYYMNKLTNEEIINYLNNRTFFMNKYKGV